MLAFCSDAACCQKIRALFFPLIFVLTTSCTHSPSYFFSPLNSISPERVEIVSIPFFPQEKYQCAPAAMAMVQNWTQVDITPRELTSELLTPAKHGSLQPALVSSARRHNRLPYPIAGLEALLIEIAAGHPVIVLQNVGVKWFPIWHYAVVIGYDLRKGSLILHSGKKPRQFMNWHQFMKAWKPAKFWGLVVLQTNQLPASADEISYLKAVLGLEQAKQWQGAATAYTAALGRWPRSFGAIIGLGNSRYATGDLFSAEEAFRKAVKLHPNKGVGYNNLSHVLAEQGRYNEAIQMARKAIQLGGNGNAKLYEQTLREIEDLKSGK